MKYRKLLCVLLALALLLALAPMAGAKGDLFVVAVTCAGKVVTAVTYSTASVHKLTVIYNVNRTVQLAGCAVNKNSGRVTVDIFVF